MIKKALQAYAEQERQIVKLMAVTSKRKKEKRHRVPLTEAEIDLLIACKIAGIHTPAQLNELVETESRMSSFVRWFERMAENDNS